MPEMLIRCVDGDARVIVGKEIAEMHCTGESNRVEAVLRELVRSQLHRVSKIVVEREQPDNRVPEVGDANMSVIDSIKNVAPVVSSVIFTARKFCVLSSKPGVVAYIVFNERRSVQVWVMLLNRVSD